MRLAAVLVAIMTAAGVGPSALAARTHLFTASYTGHATASASGTGASGSATATGRGRAIGAGTLTGSATGSFTSQTCVVFDGSAVLRGTAGTLTLAAHRQQACAPDAASAVSFSGSAAVSSGSGTFAAAHGRLSFSGSYDLQSGAVTISFRGRISY
jgi:hypothetical protein